MKKNVLIFSAFLFFLVSCSDSYDYPGDRIRIAIPDDVTTFNPMFAFTITEGVISELLYLPLVKHEWDSNTLSLKPVNYLASSWKWISDKQLEVVIKKNILWSDGKPVSLDDVVYSLTIYSDPKAKSKFYDYFGNFYTEENKKIIPEESFKQINDSTLVINFHEKSSPNLLDIDFPIIPKHFFNEIEVADLENSAKNLQPVTGGPYKISNWTRNSSLLLEPVENHFLISDNNTPKIEFVVITDYQARLLKLTNGEIDIIQDVLPEDVEEIENSGLAFTDEVQGRDYDYIGWNNIDPAAFQKGEVIPHKIFGSVQVRKALTKAINRKQILSDYLKGNGVLSNGPVTPEVLPDYKPITNYYNPEEAVQILADLGWKDSDNDGILDKDGTIFEFDLNIVTGSKRKKYTAEVVKASLGKIGIRVNIVSTEYNNFIENLFTKNTDAWIGGWYVPLPIEFNVYWNGNLEVAPYNFSSYRNQETDKLLTEFYNHSVFAPPVDLLQKIQKQIFEDHPVTFLFWVDQVFGVNKRVNNMDINPMGAIHSCWEWRVD
ncbi:MAG: ABC transporter substrate-binding protein [Melioribacteraceae bacterium]|nr:MAG: ABC transporter substrate-binding protein [Melioribacteraceae bacterium]